METHITFIHGLANKPPLKDLQRIWLDALAEETESGNGFSPELEGITVSFIYWADMFYSAPISASGYENRKKEIEANLPDRSELNENPWIQEMFKYFPIEDEENQKVIDAPIDKDTPKYERIPIPWVIKRKIIKEFLREAHDYLFNINNIKTTIQNRVLSDLASQNGKRRIVVGHSLGSVIAYDVLVACRDCPTIDAIMTIGSPLGIDEVQDKLCIGNNCGFPEKIIGDWVNVYDPFDLISRIDPNLANDFTANGECKINDISEQNYGTWRHSITKYLKGPRLRNELRRLCNRTI